MNAVALALTDTDKDLERWNALLQRLAAGTPLPDACLAAGVTHREVEAMVLGSPLEGQRWRDARLQGKASRWPLLQRDDIFDRIGAGVEVERAITEVRGGENIERDVAELFELVSELPEWQERYDAAMRALALRDSRQMLAIADDTSRDVLETPRGPIPNSAATQRDKLRVESRQWLWGKLDPDRWGERKNNVQVNVQINHAEVLESARTRERLRDKAPPLITQRVVDAAFTSEPAVEPVQAADALRAQAVAPLAEQPVDAAKPAETENPWAALEE